MEEPQKLNMTNGLEEPVDDPEPVPGTPFPAWVPALTVAVSMMLFLAGSFYIRHRKVMKKRQILMDYFYIIFQYGGMRRKRMVAALCNTNAITLRELGRSFMISFDSIANTDNSCPFYLEDTSFPNAQGSLTPHAQKRTFFRNRALSVSKRFRSPFRRANTQSEENQGPNPVSFQDILMKFKTRRGEPNIASAQASPRRRALTPHLEGSSMCTIHGDEFDFQKYMEENEWPGQYNRQRRNAYILHYDSPKPRFTDVVSEVGRRSLNNVLTDRFRAEHDPGKRNSEPWESLQNIQGSDRVGTPGQPSSVFHVQGNRLSPSSVMCGSHGYIPKAYDRSSCLQSFRNSEPTILIHSPSTEEDSSQGWSDIRHRYTNGIVFLKRVPKADGAPGEYYYEEQRSPPLDNTRRASLSKVSYVPSGNMNDYYNCFHSSKKDNTSTPDTESAAKTEVSGNVSGPPRSKRSRLSLGEIAVTNFNRRIDLPGESLHECEHENSVEVRGSQDYTAQRPKPRSTWTRFKNVFTGSRGAHSLDSQLKKSKSTSTTDERGKKRGRRPSSRWQRFVNVFTGFRSLPETKHSENSTDVLKISSSFPMGLDLQWGASQETSDVAELESEIEKVESNSLRTPGASIGGESFLSLHNEQTGRLVKAISDRPTTLNLPPKTQSFPEELVSGRQYYQRFRSVFQASRAIQNELSQTSRIGSRRYQKRSDQAVASSISLPQAKRDFNRYPFQPGYSPSQDEYRFFTYSNYAGTPRATKLDIPEENTDCDVSQVRQRFRSLSPLPERRCTSPKKTENTVLKPNVEPDSISERSVYLTPSDKEQSPHVMQSRSNASEKSEFSLYPNLRSSNVNNSPRREHTLLNVSRSVPLANKPTSSPTHGRGYCTVDIGEIHLKCGPPKVSKTVERKSEGGSSLQLHSTIPSKSQSYLDSGDKLPQNSLLTLEHRSTGRSNDSVYYDTVSAISSPSMDVRNRLDVSRSPSPSPVFGTSQGLGSNTSVDMIGKPGANRTPSPSEISGRGEEFGTPMLTHLTKPTSAKLNSPHVSRAPPPSEIRLNFLYNTAAGSTLSAPVPVQATKLTPVATRSGDTHIRQPVALKADALIHSLPAPVSEPLQKNLTQTSLTGNNSSYGPFQPVQPPTNDNDGSVFSGHVSPSSSRPVSPVTPTRRFSTPSPTPETGLPRQSGYMSPEETYMAKVSRLPRFSRRASQGTAVSTDMLHSRLLLRKGDDRNGNPRSPLVEEATTNTGSTLSSSLATSSAQSPTPPTTTTIGATHPRISAYDTLI